MKCQVCGKQREWFVKVVRYPKTGEYDPTSFEWCTSCAFRELVLSYMNETKKGERENLGVYKNGDDVVP